MKKITVRISDVEHEKLKAYAREKEQSLNNVIRDLIRSLEVSQSDRL